jgi:hypothetical protein
MLSITRSLLTSVDVQKAFFLNYCAWKLGFYYPNRSESAPQENLRIARQYLRRLRYRIGFRERRSDESL